MKKLKSLLAVFLSLALMFGVVACGDKKTEYDDYYSFDTSSIASELLYGSEMKIDPVVKNLGETVDANYSVKVVFEGQDVTESVYNAETKMFAPGEDPDAVGLYTFTLTVLDEKGNEAKDADGKPFTATFTVDYCIMNFVPKASAGADVTVDNTKPLSPVITFGETYATEGEHDSGQYRVTGVTFQGDYEIVYNVKVDAFNANGSEKRLYFGIDRTDENKRDDNIALNVEDGTLAAWFFDDNGTASGEDWTGTGWIGTQKSVSGYASLADGKTHKLGFTRVIGKGENANAYYVITWDGAYFTSLNIKGNYTDLLGGIWVESLNVQGSVSIDSYRSIEEDTAAPRVTLSYEECGVGSTVDLKAGLTVVDEVYNAYSSIEWKVTDPEGKDATPSDGKLTVNKGGVYKVEAKVTDLKGNTATAQADISVISDFTLQGLGLDTFCKVGEPISVKAVFTSDDQAMIDSSVLKIYKGDIDTKTEITGNAIDGFQFTLQDTGVYTAQMTAKSGSKDIVKSVEFTVSGADSADIDLTKNTSVARTNVKFMLYADADKVTVLQGDSLASAKDVTAETVKQYTTKTLTENITYSYFETANIGNYYIMATQGEGASEAVRAFRFTVTDNVADVWVYDNEKLDLGNGNLDKVVYGNNEMIFMDNGSTNYNTSKLVYDNLGYAGDFNIEFKITDLKYHGSNKKLFFTLGMYNEANEWGWNDITVEGSPNDDLWGYCTNLFGYGWVEYQWRSIWQEPVTNEFIPDNDPDYEGEPFTQYAFREGAEYAQYATGTHTYRIEVRRGAEGKYTVYFYIDGRPEATHRNLSYNYTTLGCVVINSDTMSGVVSDIIVEQA